MMSRLLRRAPCSYTGTRTVFRSRHLNLNLKNLSAFSTTSNYKEKNAKINSHIAKYDTREETESKETAMDILHKDSAMEKYCEGVFNLAAKNFGVALGTGVVTIPAAVALVWVAPPLAYTLPVAYFGAFGMSFHATHKLGTTEPKYNVDDNGEWVMTNREERAKYMNRIHIGMGITMAPILWLSSVDPVVLGTALVGTGVLMVGPIAAALYMPKGKLLKYGPAMYSGLFGLCAISIGGIFFPFLHHISVYGGLGFITALNAYDTHIMIKSYEEGSRDDLSHATDFSLNAINIFIRLLEIAMRARRGD